MSPTLAAGSLELKAEKENAHSGLVLSVGYNTDGDKIVSSDSDGTAGGLHDVAQTSAAEGRRSDTGRASTPTTCKDFILHPT